jgi:hypothetical protein
VQYQRETYHIDVLQQVVTEVLEEAGYTRDYAFSLEDFIQVQKSFCVSIYLFSLPLNTCKRIACCCIDSLGRNNPRKKRVFSIKRGSKGVSKAKSTAVSYHRLFAYSSMSIAVPYPSTNLVAVLYVGSTSENVFLWLLFQIIDHPGLKMEVEVPID